MQPSLRGKRVLVVDDNATNRRILTVAPGRLGHAAAGLRIAPRGARRGSRPASASTSASWTCTCRRWTAWPWPGRSGRRPAGAALPLVLFTSLGRREARAESEGFAAYLHKPIKPSQLFDALVSVLADQPVHVRERGVARSELDADMARRHPLRILLAEDNVVNQKVALRLLGQMGYRADVAANGLEAIEAVERQTYDVVLMDVQMPELDGFEASREINRRWPGERRPRIVAMTANAMQGDRELCVAAGMDDYVAKPIRVEELVAALERCRGGRSGHARPVAAGAGAGTRRRDCNPSRRSPAGSRAPTRPPGPTARRRRGHRRADVRAAHGDDGGRVRRRADRHVRRGRPGADRARCDEPWPRQTSTPFAARPIPSSPPARASAPRALATRARELETMARAGSLRERRTRLEQLAERVRVGRPPRWRSSDVTSPRNSQAGDLLVVDDNRVNRLLLGRALEQLGHTVTFAENGREALEVLRQRRVDLVLLDIEMPEMDGYQVLEALQPTRTSATSRW